MINETIEQIEEMQSHSASVVAVDAARSLRELHEREYPTVDEFLSSLRRNSEALRRANPSHATLRKTQQRIVSDVSGSEYEGVEAAKERLLAVIQDVVTEVERSKDRIAARAATLVEDGDTLLTHGYSSTVEATLAAVSDEGTGFELYVTESRPRYLGRKMARRFTDRDNVEVTLVVDSAAGYVLSDCDRVLLGMNCITDEALYNRIGTYPIVATARQERVPVTVVGSSLKMMDTGFSFENQFRSPSEVLLEPTDEFEVANPAYDRTPRALIDQVVTEDSS